MNGGTLRVNRLPAHGAAKVWGSSAARRMGLLAVAAVLIAAFLSVNCSGSSGAPAARAGGTRTTTAGNVTIGLSWDGPKSGLVFAVEMDSHSVDLDGFNLMTLSVIRTVAGVEVAPSAWDAPKGGHHRQGTLSFPATVNGRPLLDATARSLTVIVKDVASPERTFQWTW